MLHAGRSSIHAILICVQTGRAVGLGSTHNPVVLFVCFFLFCFFVYFFFFFLPLSPFLLLFPARHYSCLCECSRVVISVVVYGAPPLDQAKL